MDDPDTDRIAYEEFGLFHENIAEFHLDVDVPTVRRVESHTPSAGPAGSEPSATRAVSALRWGDEPAEVVFVHGGAQNAHTWDTVALALGRPALAVDLPGHGHSAWRRDGDYSPANLADDIAPIIAAHAPQVRAVVGMSLGGLTTMVLASRHPELVRSAVMVDITPGVNRAKTKAILDFVDGPQTFSSFAELLARTIEFNPTRSESSLRRGILHNAHQLADGSWQWNYDRTNHGGASRPGPIEPDPDGTEATVADPLPSNPLWTDFSAVGCPLMLVRGERSPVVDDDDVAEARRRCPDLEFHVVDDAGHSIQGDRPVELAALLDDWLRRQA